MRYHYKKPSGYYQLYGEHYECNHPLYNECTLFKIGNLGLAVVQRRFNANYKTTWWDEIDPWLTDEIYLNERFKDYFTLHARKKDINGLYPTVSVRKLMWALRMKPLKKEIWEKNL